MLDAQSRRVIHLLIDCARAAYCAADATQDNGDAEWVGMDRASYDSLCESLGGLDGLPDDKPGVVMGPAAKAEWALRELLARDVQPPRTPQDYAIEHAGYMADAAEHLLSRLNAEFDASEALEAAEAADAEDADERAADLGSIEQEVAEAQRGLRGAIYEFKKRRDRASADGVPEKCECGLSLVACRDPLRTQCPDGVPATAKTSGEKGNSDG